MTLSTEFTELPRDLGDLLAREAERLQVKDPRLFRCETRLDFSQQDVALDLFG